MPRIWNEGRCKRKRWKSLFGSISQRTLIHHAFQFRLVFSQSALKLLPYWRTLGLDWDMFLKMYSKSSINEWFKTKILQSWLMVLSGSLYQQRFLATFLKVFYADRIIWLLWLPKNVSKWPKSMIWTFFPKAFFQKS